MKRSEEIDLAADEAMLGVESLQPSVDELTGVIEECMKRDNVQRSEMQRVKDDVDAEDEKLSIKAQEAANLQVHWQRSTYSTHTINILTCGVYLWIG